MPILTLALGIGANTAIFSVVHGVLLAPLPFREPDRLVTVAHWYPEINLRAGVSIPGITFYRAENQVFESLSAFRGWSANLTVDGLPERIMGQRVHGIGGPAQARSEPGGGQGGSRPVGSAGAEHRRQQP